MKTKITIALIGQMAYAACIVAVVIGALWALSIAGSVARFVASLA